MLELLLIIPAIAIVLIIIVVSISYVTKHMWDLQDPTQQKERKYSILILIIIIIITAVYSLAKAKVKDNEFDYSAIHITEEDIAHAKDNAVIHPTK